jgi:hypothetical protein
MAIYRTIYEQHYGSIPTDDFGRTFEIHHKDGNRENNDIYNLVALSIEDHFDIHYKQGDWAACLAISMRMSKTPEEISKIQSMVGRKSALERKAKGTNPFCYTGEKHPRYGIPHNKEAIEKIKAKRAEQIMTKEAIERAAKTRTGQKRTEETKKLMSEKAKTRSLVTCPHCNKIGPNPQMSRWHFDNCKENS